ncbi:hypothetical protein DYB34_007873 [Aphanomyces astaci]|uniref:MYND-type domain-containing protein n=2 Tax=Aphanomyces astaci TaxID=112090 RepID=A0A397BIM6_APHAT|nr:hypothetical protein DYB36_011182 [Aphanomyces astaci]RHY68248.1 hypothetical protein DYB34_007873 [Aphanomyces astaci]
MAATRVVVPAWNCVAPVLRRLDDAELLKLQRPAPLNADPVTEWISFSKVGVGELVFATPAFAVALSRQFVATHCHMCFHKLRGKIVQCADCHFARYCDRGCMAAHLNLHTIQCHILLPQLYPPRSTHGQTNDDAADLHTRLVLAVVAMEITMNNPNVIQDLCTYTATAQDAAFLATGTTLHAAMKNTPAWITPSHIADVYRAIRYNSHPIVVDLHMSALGLGLFPDAAKMINHSCAPNTFPRFNAANHALEFRAVSPLLPGSVVTYSYLDVFGFALLQPTPTRQSLLHSAFQFDCRCSRCISTSHEQSDAWNVDAKLAQLDSAQNNQDWVAVTDVCDQIMTHWTSTLDLPANYPLMYVLQKKMDLAATHGPASRQRGNVSADEILNVCGFGNNPR